MLTRNRKGLLLLTLAGVVGLAVFAPEPGGPAAPAALAPAARNSKGADSSLPARAAVKDDSRHGGLSKFPERGTLGDPKVDLFGPQSWQPPRRKFVAAPPPRMAYRFAGRLLQDGKLEVFVSQGDTPVAIKPGDTLEGGYVVESITADAIALIYPPLGHKTSISIPSTFPALGSAPPSNALGPPPSTADSLPAQPAMSSPVPATQPRRHVPAPVAAVPKPNRKAAQLQ